MTQSDQTKNYKIDIYCFSAKHAALRSKSKDWLLRNQNVSDSSDMSTCELLFQWASTIKFYQQLIDEERRIPFIFDDFHFCLPRVIGLDMMKNRIFTLCRMITWVVFLRIFWNLSSSLLMKREGSLSFLMIFTFIVPELGALYFIQCHRKIFVMYDGIWWNFTK